MLPRALPVLLVLALTAPAASAAAATDCLELDRDEAPFALAVRYDLRSCSEGGDDAWDELDSLARQARVGQQVTPWWGVCVGVDPSSQGIVWYDLEDSCTMEPQVGALVCTLPVECDAWTGLP